MLDRAVLDLAAWLAARVGDQPGTRLAVVTGSVARDLADANSDLDVYVYRDVVDAAALAPPGRFAGIGATRVFALPTPTGWFEKLRVDGRLVDVEVVRSAVLDDLVAGLAAGTAGAAGIKVAAGLRDAVALDDGRELATWQHRLVYSDALALAEVGRHAGGLLAPTALHQLTFERGDVLSFQARLSRVLLAAVGLLGAVNRRFVPVDEPKWLRWHTDRLRILPTGLWARIDRGLLQPSSDAMADLDALLGEVLDLVDANVAGADTWAARFALALRPVG